jgi:hypothetical protein
MVFSASAQEALFGANYFDNACSRRAINTRPRFDIRAIYLYIILSESVSVCTSLDCLPFIMIVLLAY